MKSLNLGIIAHVDAGKTTLTEQILYKTNTIDSIGSIKKGTTTTDSTSIEKERGITISSAVVSFKIDNTNINLIDTPGHSDFIAEVERSLQILDGVILLVSAIEGIQPQTKVLSRIINDLQIPFIVFINKIDTTRLDINILKEEIKSLFNKSIIILTGSAKVDIGIDELLRKLPKLFNPKEKNINDTLSGDIFKYDLNKNAFYISLESGKIKVKDTLLVNGFKEKGQKIEQFKKGMFVNVNSISAGEIGLIYGFESVKVGDTIGKSKPKNNFIKPFFESVISTKKVEDKIKLLPALEKLSKADPLISIKYIKEQDKILICLFGEIQKQVIQQILKEDFGLETIFSKPIISLIEKPSNTGYWIEEKCEVGKNAASFDGYSNPFLATIGFMVKPNLDSKPVFEIDKQAKGKAPHAFYRIIEESVFDTLQSGVYGWEVKNCRVILTEIDYWPRQSSSHGNFDKSISSSGRDFRYLTPLVLMNALQKSNVELFEPINSCEIIANSNFSKIIYDCITKNNAVVLETILINEITKFVVEVKLENLDVLYKEIQNLGITGLEFYSQFNNYSKYFGNMKINTTNRINPLNRNEYLTKILKEYY